MHTSSSKVLEPSSKTATERAVSIDSTARVTAPDTVRRRLRVRMGMCGPNTLFLTQFADWIWDAVTSLCETDVMTAQAATGKPTYLAFYYIRLRADPQFHIGSLRAGEVLDIESRFYNFGSESILGLHRIAPGSTAANERNLDEVEFYASPQPGCVYIESVSRWVSRHSKGSNEGMVRASPPEFRYQHLPTLSERNSPRATWSRARMLRTFHVEDPQYRLVTDEFCATYTVDITRDLNAVGLLYCVSYFAVVDRAILLLWRHLGRADAEFLERAVLDHQICFLANADIGASFDLRMRRWESVADPREEIVNVEVSENDRSIAIATVKTMRVGRAEPGNGHHESQ